MEETRKSTNSCALEYVFTNLGKHEQAIRNFSHRYTRQVQINRSFRRAGLMMCGGVIIALWRGMEQEKRINTLEARLNALEGIDAVATPDGTLHKLLRPSKSAVTEQEESQKEE